MNIVYLIGLIICEIIVVYYALKTNCTYGELISHILVVILWPGLLLGFYVTEVTDNIRYDFNNWLERPLRKAK